MIWPDGALLSFRQARPDPGPTLPFQSRGEASAPPLAMRSLPLGTAYMIWTGIGALGAFAVGVAFLGEAISPARLAAAALILSGLVMMKLASPG